jgi:hypothetical protein
VQPIAYMRRWAFDKIDVMKMPKKDRPKGWGFLEVTSVQYMDDDVPLYAASAFAAIPAKLAEAERQAALWNEGAEAMSERIEILFTMRCPFMYRPETLAEDLKELERQFLDTLATGVAGTSFREVGVLRCKPAPEYKPAIPLDVRVTVGVHHLKNVVDGNGNMRAMTPTEISAFSVAQPPAPQGSSSD